MGKIANIYKTNKFAWEKSKEVLDVMKAPIGKEKNYDYADLYGVAENADPTVFGPFCRQLRSQSPKVQIPEEIIVVPIGQFTVNEIANELAAMEDLVNTVLESGARLTHKTLENIANSKTCPGNKSKMYEFVIQKMIDSHIFDDQVVEYALGHLKILGITKGQVFEAYLNSNDDADDANKALGKLSTKMKTLATQQGINLEQRVKDRASAIAMNKRDADRLAAARRAAAEKKLHEVEQKEVESCSNGPRTW